MMSILSLYSGLSSIHRMSTPIAETYDVEDPRPFLRIELIVFWLLASGFWLLAPSTHTEFPEFSKKKLKPETGKGDFIGRGDCRASVQHG